jgi:putative hydrolase of the HAD superfamily
MPSHTGIKRIFFDVGGVCLTNGWDEAAREKAARHFSIDLNETEDRHERIFEKFEKGLISRNEYLDQVYFFRERSFSRETFTSFMESQSIPFDTTFTLLDKLKKNGRYILSTINNESLELNLHRIKTCKLAAYFSTFFSSCFLHLRKPEAEIFQKVLQMTQAIPEECLFIDDREENIEQAAKQGFQVLHAKDIEKLGSQLTKKLKENEKI